MKAVIHGIAIVATLGFMQSPAQAGEADQCLDCHVPAEDWVGMSPDELMKAAMDSGNKRHKDHMDLTEEQLKAIFAELMPK